MRPKRLELTPLAADSDGLGNDHTGATSPFTPNVATALSDGMGHLITLTSAADLSSIDFTLIGKNESGEPQEETLAGPNAGSVSSALFFSEVTSVEISGTLGANTVDVGWAAESVSPIVPLDWKQESGFGVSLGLVLGGTIDVDVEHCLESLLDVAPEDRTWFPHSSLAGETASADGNYAFPVTGTRLHVNSHTSGTAVFLVVQGR